MSLHSPSLNCPAASLGMFKRLLAELSLLWLLFAHLRYMPGLLSAFGVHYIRCAFLSAGGGGDVEHS